MRLEGTVRRIVFERDGFAIVRLDVASGDSIPCVGDLRGAKVGERVRVEGEWTQHDRFGRQFRVVEATVVPPTTAEGVERYLASGAIPGIGPELAKRIVSILGADALDVIDKEPTRLARVPGIGPKRRSQIVATLRSVSRTSETANPTPPRRSK